eukprot:1062404-Rhodomonas_salina.1
MNKILEIRLAEEPELYLLDDETGEPLPGQTLYKMKLKPAHREKGSKQWVPIDVEDRSITSMIEKYAYNLWKRKTRRSFHAVIDLPRLGGRFQVVTRESLGLPAPAAVFDLMKGIGVFTAIGPLP